MCLAISTTKAQQKLKCGFKVALAFLSKSQGPAECVNKREIFCNKGKLTLH